MSYLISQIISFLIATLIAILLLMPLGFLGYRLTKKENRKGYIRTTLIVAIITIAIFTFRMVRKWQENWNNVEEENTAETQTKVVEE